MSVSQEFQQLISYLIEEDAFFSAYSLPSQKRVELIIQTSESIQEVSEIPASEKGFVLFPFNREDTGLFINGDYITNSEEETYKLPQEFAYNNQFKYADPKDSDFNEYTDQANEAIQRMKEGNVHKIVLSRTKTIPFTHDKIVPTFFNINSMYEEAFVFLVNIPGRTIWIGASPETFIRKNDDKASSMALAATKKGGDDSAWTEKEEKEQKYVSDFIEEKLNEFELPYSKSELYDKVLSSGIKHLCNDFSFEINEDVFSKLVDQLHPTPAVAGIPRAISLNHIKEIETHEREFYAGFLGPVNSQGHTDLFVNLRSAKLSEDVLCLFVGGGLTKDSNVEDEWYETELKATSILKALSVG